MYPEEGCEKGRRLQASTVIMRKAPRALILIPTKLHRASVTGRNVAVFEEGYPTSSTDMCHITDSPSSIHTDKESST